MVKKNANELFVYILSKDVACSRYKKQIDQSLSEFHPMIID